MNKFDWIVLIVAIILLAIIAFNLCQSTIESQSMCHSMNLTGCDGYP